jgi:signal transduction histidine kinase
MTTTRSITWRPLPSAARVAGVFRVTDVSRAVDAVLVLACLGLSVLATKGEWSSLPRPVIAVAGVAGSLAQWPRRRWPQFATVVAAPMYALSGNPGPLVAGLYSSGVYAPRRQVWVLALVGWAGFDAWSVIDSGHWKVSDAVYAVLFTVPVVLVGVYLATRNALLASLRERAEHAEQERQLRDERARAAERTRIAREMHDVLAHKVSLIALHAGALEVSANGNPARFAQGAALIRVTAREALQELQMVLGVLRADADPRSGQPGPPDPGEPFADLESLVRTSVQAGQRVELHDEVGRLPSASARVVHRVAQEGLTNARKHAPGAPVAVSVTRGDGGTVVVTVRNAPGAERALDLPGSGAGLIGLAERLRLVGGSLSSGPLGNDEPAGWQLRAVVPWIDQRIEKAYEETDLAAGSRSEAP